MTDYEKRKEGDDLMTCFVIHVSLLSLHIFLETAEVSSIMRELARRSLTGTYLYSLCVKPGISTTSASKRSHC